MIEWSSVHDERPRASTSGGQSAGRDGIVAAAAAVAVAVVLGFLPASAKRSATLLHVRHL